MITMYNKLYSAAIRRIAALLLLPCVMMGAVFSFYCIPARAAETATSSEKLAIPLTTFVAAVLTGSGIITKSAGSAAKKLIDDVSDDITKQAKEKVVDFSDWVKSKGQSTSGGGDQWQNDPDDDPDKNYVMGTPGGKGGVLFASALVSAIMAAAYNYKAYEQTDSIVNDLVSVSTLGNWDSLLSKVPRTVQVQLNLIKSLSSYSDSIGESLYYYVQFSQSDIESDLYPETRLRFIVNYNGSKENYKYYKVVNSSGNYILHFYNEDEVIISNTVVCDQYIKSRKSGDDPKVGWYDNGPTHKSDSFTVYQDGYSTEGSWSSKWLNYTNINMGYTSPYQYTNNVYNYNLTLPKNFPNWNQISDQIQTGISNAISSINLPSINVNIPAINGQLPSVDDLINNSGEGDAADQTVIQTGITPTTIIDAMRAIYAQAQPNPDPDPRPEPEPDPEPAPDIQPAVEEAIKPITESIPDPDDLPDDDALEDGSKKLFNFGIDKLSVLIPWDKVPFCIPYDIYLFFNALYNPSASASGGSPVDPKTVSITYSPINHDMTVGSTDISWKPAPIIHINISGYDLGSVGGQNYSTDIKYDIDLSKWNYLAMLVYWSIAVEATIATIIGIKNSFTSVL